MKTVLSTVKKLLITDVAGLDPITVFLEDFEPRKGKITIECYGKSCSAYWGGMGGRTIAEFFASCDNDYLAGNLSPSLRSTVTDNEGLPDHARKHICKIRRTDDIHAGDARDLYDDADRLSDGPNGHESFMFDVFGDDWHFDLPEKPNHKYKYLCKIIDAVRDGIKASAV